VVAASDLIAALDAAVTRAGIAYRESTKVAALAIRRISLTAFAEGAVDPAAGKRRDYGQHAVLCNVERRRTASQCRLGTLHRRRSAGAAAAGRALFGGADLRRRIAGRGQALDDEAFLALLQRRFGTRHRFTAATPRVAYPLGCAIGRIRWRAPGLARQCGADPAPGCRAGLQPGPARYLGTDARRWRGRADPGAPDVLAAYARGRQADRRGAIGFTDLLIDGFASDFPPLRHARGAGLLALDLLPRCADLSPSG
jgi:2-octaprenyl-6-methoxyphenol hydroxylase